MWEIYVYSTYNVGQQWSPASQLWNARVLASRKKLVVPPVVGFYVKWPVHYHQTLWSGQWEAVGQSPMLPEAVVVLLWAEQNNSMEMAECVVEYDYDAELSDELNIRYE